MTDWEKLYASIPSGSKYRKIASVAHGYGYDAGANEARVEILFALRRAIGGGVDPIGEINRKLDKLRHNGRMPAGFDQDEE